MFWQQDIETLPKEELQALQLAQLKQTVAWAMQAPYYAKTLKQLNVSPDNITKLDDLRRLPFTTKQELRDHFPYGLLARPLEDIVRLHSSSGTTGTPTVVFHTQRDLDIWADIVARSMYMTGTRKNDVFQNMMGYGLFTGGLGLHYGAERLGALTIPAGSGNSKRQIMLMRTFGTTVIHIIPSYALKLATVFEEMGLDPKTDTKLRIAFIGAEPHSEATRDRIEDIYGIDAFNSYGLSEMCGPGVAFECPQKQGMHVWEDNYIVEVVDPDTLEPVEDGQQGELVFTTLKRTGMPLLRYRTRDISAIYSQPCSCGRTHRRISRIKGRTDDMLIVKGVNLFPMQIETALMSIPEVGTNYVMVLDKQGPMDVLVVKVEAQEEVLSKGLRHLERLRERIARTLRDEILLTPEVELVEPGSLPTSEGKAQRVIDRRKL